MFCFCLVLVLLVAVGVFLFLLYFFLGGCFCVALLCLLKYFFVLFFVAVSFCLFWKHCFPCNSSVLGFNVGVQCLFLISVFGFCFLLLFCLFLVSRCSYGVCARWRHLHQMGAATNSEYCSSSLNIDLTDANYGLSCKKRRSESFAWICSSNPCPQYFWQGVVMQMGDALHKYGWCVRYFQPTEGILAQKHNTTNRSCIVAFLEHRGRELMQLSWLWIFMKCQCPQCTIIRSLFSHCDAWHAGGMPEVSRQIKSHLRSGCGTAGRCTAQDGQKMARTTIVVKMTIFQTGFWHSRDQHGSRWSILVEFGLKRSTLIHLGPPTIL